jgi:hypothetical protein
VADPGVVRLVRSNPPPPQANDVIYTFQRKKNRDSLEVRLYHFGSLNLVY